MFESPGLVTGLVTGSPENEATPQQKTPLYLAGFFSFNTEPDTSGILPAVDMALDHINEKSDILSDYELKMDWKDIKVSVYSLF